MKRLLAYLFLVLVLTFSLQSLTKANDSIRDFQIEGMSIGDSLLIHISKNEIDQLKKYQVYPNKDYFTLYIEKEFRNSDKVFQVEYPSKIHF